MVKHKTERIIIKMVEAEVDEKIAPVVVWLNSYDSVTTQFSCQGSGNSLPYALFCCFDGMDLFDICKKLIQFATIEVSISTKETQPPGFPPYLRYTARFFSTRQLAKFVEEIDTWDFWEDLIIDPRSMK